MRALEMLVLSATVLLAQVSPFADAVQASPFRFTVTQPNGLPLTLAVIGDEYRHWLEEPSTGYAVMQTEANGRAQFVYTCYNTTRGEALPSSVLVGSTDPTGFNAMLAPPIHQSFAGGWSTMGSEFAAQTVNDFAAQMISAAGSQSTIAIGASGTPPLVTGQLLTTEQLSSMLPSVGLTTLGRRRMADPESHHRHARSVPAVGRFKNLVVMIRWADFPYRPRTANTAGLPTVADLNRMFNGDQPSVRHAYLQNSYGKLTIDSVFTDWITVSFNESQAASGCCTLQPALTEALRIANTRMAFKNFDLNGDSSIDFITFLHSGYGAEWGVNIPSRIWSHKSVINPPFISSDGVSVSNYHIETAFWGYSGTEMAHIGVVTHELGHFLGLPDLYDLSSPPGAGIGSYSLMANPWGFDYSQNFPPLMDAWSRITLGWVTPSLLTVTGTYTVSVSVAVPQVFMITHGFPRGEYLLIENRQPMGYDGDMPQGGLCIYHVDEYVREWYSEGYPGMARAANERPWPYNGKHYMVAMLQADGRYDMEATNQRGDSMDVYYKGGTARIGPDTVPNTNAYQNGNVYRTDIVITVLSAPGYSMQFSVIIPTCSDGVQNQNETGVDCGGPLCPACSGNSVSCTDGRKNGQETAVDCGGPACRSCPRSYAVAGQPPSSSTTRAPTTSTRTPTRTPTTSTRAPTTSTRAPTSTTRARTTTTTTRPTSTSKSPTSTASASRAKAISTPSPTRTTTTRQPTSASTPRSTSSRRTTATSTSRPTATLAPSALSSLAITFMAVTEEPQRVANTTLYRARATVRVANSAGNYISGAQVIGRFVRASASPVVKQAASGTTSAAPTYRGTATVLGPSLWKSKDANLWFCVTGVNKSSFYYVPAKNNVTCISVAGKRSTKLLY